MKELIERIRVSLDRDRALPLGVRLAKGGRFAAATALAPVYLRGCTRVGARPRAIGRPRIENRGELHLGDDLILNSTFAPAELEVGEGAQLRIGHRAAINFGTLIAARRRVTLGDEVSVGPYCVVADHDHAGAPEPDQGEPRPVQIGDRVWLAARVTVLPGAHIGSGSVITAGSVVEGEIPPNVVAGGSPARVLRANRGPQPVNELVVEPATEPQPQPQPGPALRGALIADFTLGDLAARLGDGRESPRLEVVDAPSVPVGQALLTPRAEPLDFALVWSRPELTSAAFARLLDGDPVQQSELEADVDAFCDLLLKAQGYRFVLVASFVLPQGRRGLGLLDARPPRGRAWALAVMNARLMQRLADAPSTYVLDASRWLAAAGPAGSSAKGWYLGKVLFQGEVLAEAAREVRAALQAALGQSRKLVVLDLDDTLWGGILGDVGWENLVLGGHHPEGEAFAELQRRLLALTRRGIVLGIVSKNDEATALEALERHPEMRLRKRDFVGWRINWQDKARNIAELAQELNLGLQSVVFIDDNPAERARVREALPEVLVPEWPADKLLAPDALEQLRCLDVASIGSEDTARTALYAAERDRSALRREVADLESWLRELKITVRAEPLGAANLSRALQLLNKTNQLNLSTRRLSDPELRAWASAPHRALWTLHVRDRFGDAGLTGIVGVERDGELARIADFVLSCRVFGRKIEHAMLHLAVDWARQRGAAHLHAEYVPTPKNKPTLQFLAASGLQQEGNLFKWDAARPYPLPDCIQLTREDR